MSILDDDLDAFWADARIHARLNDAPGYLGATPLDTLRPPAAKWGGTDEVATVLAELIVDGVKTATSSALWDYEAEGEPIPEVGTLEIVLDGSSRPRALIVNTEVETVPFCEVGAEHAFAEGEQDRSLDSWRTIHEAFFRTYAAHDRPFTPDLPVVLQRFRVLHVSA